MSQSAGDWGFTTMSMTERKQEEPKIKGTF